MNLRRPPDILSRLTAARWWRWQTAAVIAGLMLAAAVLLGAGSSYIDERSDVADADSARLRDRRAEYETECRFRLNLRVTEIEGQQLDGLSDLLTALAHDDETAARAVVDDLADLKVDKDEAEVDRAAAVETCGAEARDLFPSG